ncbi:hypothetical protein F441_18915 [Phytophthora nicotianae CJ01A1]|uniref:Uncharacterized protein n=4 Tax=Phytophthora nicotianae TaxID=4792 RepID=V9E771_PHYNI|nr:hypothetical protein F443_19105 [Phytophthora nicotianae P1569]ETK74734.1 hypothetical protein L915_18529 [Phytophthora nicotianae]ETO63174.1 hypothetical protein F444_19061 [Phytophthora nicotianae P1976]ETP04284.1 hypothetical protein F441_18915 [Phytophthora nicotianae CJ01A1]ETL28158.1 hypothetical protein L916_18429 [Phytophthora nicotianae]
MSSLEAARRSYCAIRIALLIDCHRHWDLSVRWDGWDGGRTRSGHSRRQCDCTAFELQWWRYISTTKMDLPVVRAHLLEDQVTGEYTRAIHSVRMGRQMPCYCTSAGHKNCCTSICALLVA